MSFDLLAPHYRWMEWVLAGPRLQRCRTAFLHQVPAPRHALLVGEGTGNFLVELLRAHPHAQLTCLDASSRMLDCARDRLRALGIATDNIRFVHADLLEWSPPQRQFDLIVSHFFLDCFRPEQLELILSRLASSATPSAHWLLADFQEASTGWAKLRTRLILRSMYLFFRFATRLPASHLTPPDAGLQAQGFTLRDRRFSEWGLLHSDLWVRQEGA